MAGEQNPGRNSAIQKTATAAVAGRTREQRLLGDELSEALAGAGRLVLISGEAGIGKTTLARDLARTAHFRGARVLTGACYDLANTPPYGPWLDLFARCEFEPGLPAPLAYFAGGQLAEITDRTALYAEARRFLTALTAEEPALIVFEDLHWADPASLDLLRHLAPHLGQWPLMLVVTYRTDELTKQWPFFHQLPALIREGEGRRLDLHGLHENDLRAVVELRFSLPTSDRERLVAYLSRHSDGNPFFATELLRTLEEEMLLRRTENGWQLAELDRVIVPSLLRQVIAGRLARLGDGVRHPLSIASVIGQEAPIAAWARVAGLSEAELMDIVELATDAHVLYPAPDGSRIRFVHALTREALYETVLPPRRRLWHRMVANALLEASPADPDAVAYHLHRAGDARAWEWLVTAAGRAQRAYAWITAAERLRTAVTLLEEREGTEQTRCNLLLRVARLLRLSDPLASVAALNEARRLAPGLEDTFQVNEIDYAHAFPLGYADRFRECLETMTAAVSAYESDPFDARRSALSLRNWFTEAGAASDGDLNSDVDLLTRLRTFGIDYRRSTQHWAEAEIGRTHHAIKEAERFIELVPWESGVRGGVRICTAFSNYALGIAYAALSRPDDARRMFTLSRERFAEVEHFGLIGFTLLRELRDVALTYGAGDPGSRRWCSAEGELALGRAGGALRTGTSPRIAWLGTLVLDGEWDAADRILLDLADPGISYLRREIAAARIQLARQRGDSDLARSEIGKRLPQGPRTEPGNHIFQEGLFLIREAAAICLAENDLEGAKVWMEMHDRWIGAENVRLGAADGQLAWAAFYLAAGNAARARSLAMAGLALAESPEQPLVRLRANRLLAEIDLDAGRFSSAEGHLSASLDLAARCEAPFERALTLVIQSELMLATEQRELARSAADDARWILTKLGANPALACLAVIDRRLEAHEREEKPPFGLTPRELEVLQLLIEHLTNKEIGERLFVSPRTIQTHVEHICAKLGVENRREAANQALRAGITPL